MNHLLKKAVTLGVSDLFSYAEIDDRTLNLAIGEPAFPTPKPIIDALIESLHHNKQGYAPAQGKLQVRQAVADYTYRRFKTEISPDHVLITQGSSEAAACILFSLFNPGDELIIPTPSYPLYKSLCAMAGIVYKEMDTAYDDYELNPASLKKAISSKTKALLLTSPQNPSGKVIPVETLKSILTQTSLWVIVDQVYADLVYDEDFQSLSPKDYPNLMVIQSFSKAYAMTGWRLAYLLASTDIMPLLLKWHHNILTSVTSFVQDVIPAALKTDTSSMREHYRKQRDKACQALDAMGLTYIRPQGAFYILIDIKPFAMDSLSFCKACHDKVHLLLVPGIHFGAEGFVRLSFSVENSLLEKGLEALKTFTDHLKNEEIL